MPSKFLNGIKPANCGPKTEKNRSVYSERTKKLVYTALLTALVAALSQIAVPLPGGIPLTLQTFAIAFAAYFAGPKYGLFSVVIYIALGAIGAPVFSGFSGGAARLIMPSGGFIWGFLPMAFISAAPNKRGGALMSVVFGLIGLAICHVMGVAQFSLVTGTDLRASFMVASLPFMAKDAASVVSAYFLASTVKKRLGQVA